MLSFFPSALHPAGFLGAAVFSVASCFLIARFSRMNPALSVRRRLLGSLGLGLTFWLTHLLITMSVPFRFSLYEYGLHFVFSLVTSTAGSYLAVGYATRQWVSTRRFLIGGVILAAIILLFDILNAVQLFGTFLEWKPELLLLTFGLTLGVSFSVLRMLTIASQDKPDQSFRLLVILGVGTAGVALSGIPVLSMMAVLRLDAFYPTASSPTAFLGCMRWSSCFFSPCSSSPTGMGRAGGWSRPRGFSRRNSSMPRSMKPTRTGCSRPIFTAASRGSTSRPKP
ncbi:hypothetical protein N6H14_01720 [Paenibacillus sp. CC-CFT747]|nr:hypothetical protein N6H14_01720 [Paenibacillus sp. CC-CFT747]